MKHSTTIYGAAAGHTIRHTCRTTRGTPSSPPPHPAAVRTIPHRRSAVPVQHPHGQLWGWWMGGREEGGWGGGAAHARVAGGRVGGEGVTVTATMGGGGGIYPVSAPRKLTRGWADNTTPVSSPIAAAAATQRHFQIIKPQSTPPSQQQHRDTFRSHNLIPPPPSQQRHRDTLHHTTQGPPKPTSNHSNARETHATESLRRLALPALNTHLHTRWAERRLRGCG